MLKRTIICLMVICAVITLQSVPLFAADVCRQEKIDKLAAAGLSKEQIFRVCPQVECSKQRIANLKDAGLDDCEIDQLCPGHFDRRVIELKELGLKDHEIAELFPDCLTVNEPPVPLDEPDLGTSQGSTVDEGTLIDASDKRADITQSICRNCRNGDGQLDIEVMSGRNNVAGDALLSLGSLAMGSWHTVTMFLDDQQIGEGKTISGQVVAVSKAVPVGKHEVKVQVRQMALLILPTPRREYKATINIHEGNVTKVKVYLSEMYAGITDTEDPSAEEE